MNRVVVSSVNLNAVENQLFERGKLPLESLQSGFQPHWPSSPLACLLRDATMQLQKAHADIAHLSTRASRCGHRHIFGGSKDLLRHALLQRADRDWGLSSIEPNDGSGVYRCPAGEQLLYERGGRQAATA